MHIRFSYTRVHCIVNTPAHSPARPPARSAVRVRGVHPRPVRPEGGDHDQLLHRVLGVVQLAVRGVSGSQLVGRAVFETKLQLSRNPWYDLLNNCDRRDWLPQAGYYSR